MIPGFLGTTLNGAVKKIYGTRKPLKIHGKSSCQNLTTVPQKSARNPPTHPISIYLAITFVYTVDRVPLRHHGMTCKVMLRQDEKAALF